jgi:glycosyltransferase involved in cell wall biosynthesis
MLVTDRSAGPGPPLVVFADDWGRHPSSVQHLVRRLRGRMPVLWVNSIGTRKVKADALTFRRGVEKLRNWRTGLRQVAEQMWVIDVPMVPGLGTDLVRGLNRSLVTSRLKRVLSRLGMARPVVLTTLPYIGWLIRDLPRRALVYYCTDDYSHWPSADRAALQEADREITAAADLVLAASRALVKSHSATGRCEYFPHGVDFDHFTSAQKQDWLPPDVAGLPGPRIGFFGLIYEKLNFDLLTAVARHHPKGSLVMIGPSAYCPPEFAAVPNVHLLGRRPYEDLPRYLAGLDVLLLPYVDDDMIRQSGPLKLRECLASGKPTVSIDVPEVRTFQPHVRVAGDTEAFLRQVEEALAEPADPAVIHGRQRAVEQDGWDRRAEQLGRAVTRLVRERNGVPHANGHRSRRRVLHFRTVAGKGGGPEKTLLNSPRFLKGVYDMRLAYIRPEDDPDYDMPERARQLGVDLVDIPERGGADPRTLWRLVREVREYRPDILHPHDYKTDVLAVLLGRWFRIPVVTTMHGYVTRGGRLEAYYLVDRWALRRMDHVIAVSEDLYRAALDSHVPPARCTLIENAIDTQQYARRHPVAAAKARLGFDPGRLLIGAVGRLSAEKGFDVLIRAADRLLREGLDVGLEIVGEGPDRPALESLIAELGRTDRIHLLGYRSDTMEVYQAMDAFALSSLREGLPNVLLEAMALEVPVVATRVAGVPRLIRDGEDGILVEPGSAEELAGALGRLLRDDGLSRAVGAAGRRTIEARYSFAVRMQKVRAVYDALLASPARVAATR